MADELTAEQRREVAEGLCRLAEMPTDEPGRDDARMRGYLRGAAEGVTTGIESVEGVPDRSQ